MTDQFAFDVGDRPSLDVQIAKGSLDVRNGSPGRIVVSVDRPDDWEVTSVADSVTVSPRDRRRVPPSRVVAVVPSGTRIEARSASARIRIDGDHGDVAITTASGDIGVGGGCSALSVTTASGDLRGGEVRGDAEVKSVSGDVDLGSVGGRLAVTTTSGDIRVRAVGGEVAIATTSGDVEVRRTDADTIAVRTVSGDVRVGLPTGIRVCPDLRTLSGRTRLPAPRANPEADGIAFEDRRMVRLNVRTVSGDIDVARAD
jgi:DUF4097 and DUF4098 domain-containing protein YvlB